MTRLFLAAALLGAAASANAAIFIVRHAERLDAKDDASLISPAGKKRALELKRVLASVALKAVYCTEYARTRQTAEPSARAHGLASEAVASEKTAGLAAALKARPEDEDVLVVGHTDTIPELLQALGVDARVAIGSGEYDNLFIVTRREGRKPLFHRLRYGPR